MLNLYRIVSMFIVMMLGHVSSHAGHPDDILGHWRTFDDMTGFAKSIVRIEKSKSGLYVARIVEIIPRPDYTARETCYRCPAPFTNQKILGLTIVWNLQANPNEQDTQQYNKGYVLDPLSGKIYQTQVTLAADNRSLKLRGSVVGAPMIGRSQTWRRETADQRK